MSAQVIGFHHAMEAERDPAGRWKVAVRTIKKVQGGSQDGADSRLHQLPDTFSTRDEAEAAGWAYTRTEFKGW